MMKNLTYLVKLFTIFVIYSVSISEGKISDKRMCADLKCSVPISVARGVLRYNSDDERILSFAPGETLTIYSKEAGERKDLWGAEIRGKRGYVPKSLVKEIKILSKETLYEVPTAEAAIQDDVKVEQSTDVPVPVSDEQPANEQGPMYVIDGTTLYLPEDSSMQMTTNVEPQSTTTTTLAPDTQSAQESASQETSVDHTASEASSAETIPDIKPVEEVTERDEVASSTVTPLPIVQAPVEENKESEETKESDEEVDTENTTEEKVEPKISAEVDEEVKITELDSENKSGELGKDSSVYGYLSDTITGWMSGDGEDNEEEEDEEEYEEEETDSQETEESDEGKDLASDTGQVNKTLDAPADSDSNQEKIYIDQEQIESKSEDNVINVLVEEPVTSEPEIVLKVEEMPVTESNLIPENIVEVETLEKQPKMDVDLPKTISLLSVNPNTIMPEMQISSGEVDTITIPSQISQETQNEEPNLIDEINYQQGQSTEYVTEVPISSFNYLGSSNNFQDSREVYTQSPDLHKIEEIQTEQQQSQEEKSEEVVEEIVTPPSVEDLEPPQIKETETTIPEESDASTPSPIFYEPSPSELPSQEQSESPIVAENLSNVEEFNISDNKDITEDNIKPETKIEGTFEEITTSAPTSVVEDVDAEVESGSLFASWVYTLFGYGSTEDEEGDNVSEVTEDVETTEAVVSETSEEPPASSSWWWSSSSSIEEPVIETKQTCNAESGELGCEDIGSVPNMKQEEIVTPSSIPHHQYKSAEEEATVATMDWEAVASSDKTILLVITSVTVLIFTLGYYYLEKSKKDDVLIAKINALQKELLVSSKECLILKDDLDLTKEKLTCVETTSSGSSVEVTSIKLELEQSQEKCGELEEQVISLEKELEAATEAGLELNALLSEFLSAQKGSEDLTKGVELLQQQLNKQQATISSMSQDLLAKAKETEQAQSDLVASQDKVLELETELAKLQERLEEVQKSKQQLTEDLEESCVTLANQLQEAAHLQDDEVNGLKQQLEASEVRLKEVEESLRSRSSELEVLQASLAKVQTLGGDDSEEGQKKLQALLDVGKAQAELKLITSERDVLKERLQCEEDARQLLEDHVKVICVEVEKLRERHEVAEKEKMEAQTKLEVLSSYFKEKETQLQKELGLQEAMCEQKKEDVSVTHVRIKTLQEEIENYKGSTRSLFSSCISCSTPKKQTKDSPSKKNHSTYNKNNPSPPSSQNESTPSKNGPSTPIKTNKSPPNKSSKTSDSPSNKPRKNSDTPLNKPRKNSDSPLYKPIKTIDSPPHKPIKNIDSPPNKSIINSEPPPNMTKEQHLMENHEFPQNKNDFPLANKIDITPPRSYKPSPPDSNNPSQTASPMKIRGTQNETLKQEIVEQERSLKGQITSLEKKAHENWIAARQAERKLDETKQEAGTLRNRLTMLEKGPVVAQNGEDTKQMQRLDANGELLPTSPMLHIGDSPSMSPPHLVGGPPHYMMMPPPPPPTGSYMPPPPPPEYLHSPPPPLPLYPDRRPPPLGRMSSPPPHHFSPPPDRYSSPYRPRSPASDRSLPRYRYSSRSPSPPPYGHPDYAPYPPAARQWDEPRAGFRPLHRDNKDQKGSTLSSGHSSESLEKSSRHSGGKS